jgi:Kef-type K+ transport system membrane component KefB
VVAAVGVTLGRARRNIRLDAFLTRLQDTTAEIRVRIAVALLIGFVALAAKIGLQTILGAFLAGVVLNLVDRDTASHPVFRSKLDALGYGFLIPVFFVSSGVEFDLGALTRSPSVVARIPLFLLALLIVRGAPAALYTHSRQPRRGRCRVSASHLTARHRHRGVHRSRDPSHRARDGLGTRGRRPYVSARLPPYRARCDPRRPNPDTAS